VRAKMSEEERRLERRFKDGKWWIREWKPGEWREATPEEVEEITKVRRRAEELFQDVEDAFTRLRRFARKFREAVDELWGP